MFYFIYKITNTKNGKIFIGKFKGNTRSFKLLHSSNKFLKEDIKIYGSNNFKKEIVKEFNNSEELNCAYNKIVDDKFKERTDTYNYHYTMSSTGKSNISKGRRTKEKQKLNLIYPKFNYTIERYEKNFFIIKNFCKHGDLIITQNSFNHIYNDNNFHYCQACFLDSMQKYEYTNEQLIDNIKKIKNILKGPKSSSENYILTSFPTVYKSILDWSKHIPNIEFNERLYLAKNFLKERPTCLCCENDVFFSKSHKRYTLYCSKHVLQHHTSKKEQELYEFVKNLYNKEIIQNYSLEGKEIDIYIPELKLGIEFNGLYWHSDDLKDKTYHYNKWKLCLDKDIRLITIWEDDWDYKKEIIKSIVRYNLNKIKTVVYARNCIIKEVKYKEKQLFLENNHLQGDVKSSVNIGLYYNNELVSLMTFGKKRKFIGNNSNKLDNEYELLRYCSKINMLIVGGASKLFNYFIKTYEPVSILSYASCDISLGKLYKTLSFKETNHTGLNYWWAKDKRYHRTNFMKFKLSSIDNKKNLTEDTIMRNQGYMKIYGSGNLRYVWTSKI